MSILISINLLTHLIKTFHVLNVLNHTNFRNEYQWMLVVVNRMDNNKLITINRSIENQSFLVDFSFSFNEWQRQTFFLSKLYIKANYSPMAVQLCAHIFMEYIFWFCTIHWQKVWFIELKVVWILKNKHGESNSSIEANPSLSIIARIYRSRNHQAE